VAGLRAGQLRNHGSIPGRRSRFISFFIKRPELLWGPHSPLFSRYRDNRPGREIGHSPSCICSAEVRSEWSYSYTFDMRSWNGQGLLYFLLWLITWRVDAHPHSWVGKMIGCGRTSEVRLLAAVGIFLCAPTCNNAVGVSLQCTGTDSSWSKAAGT
jgi:hypothetical protein